MRPAAATRNRSADLRAIVQRGMVSARTAATSSSRTSEVDGASPASSCRTRAPRGLSRSAARCADGKPGGGVDEDHGAQLGDLDEALEPVRHEPPGQTDGRDPRPIAHGPHDRFDIACVMETMPYQRA